MRRVGEKRRHSGTDSLEGLTSSPAKRPRRSVREGGQEENSPGILSRIVQLTRKLFSFQWFFNTADNVSTPPRPTPSPLTHPGVIVIEDEDTLMAEAPTAVRSSPPPSFATQRSPQTTPPHLTVSSRSPPHPPPQDQPLPQDSALNRSNALHPQAVHPENKPPAKRKPSRPRANVLRGLEAARDQRCYQQFLNNQSRSLSPPLTPPLSNHVLHRRQPESIGHVPSPPTIPSPLAAHSPTFYTLPQRSSSPIFHTSHTLTSTRHNRTPHTSSSMGSSISQSQHRQFQFRSQWSSRDNGVTVCREDGVRGEGVRSVRKETEDPLGSTSKDKTARPLPVQPSRSGEVQQWRHWLDALNRDNFKSRRQAEIEVAEKYLRLYQQDRERLEDARTERLRKQIDRIGLEEDAEEEMNLFLTPEQKKRVSDATRCHVSEVLSDKFRIQIKGCDIATLTGLEWLNDEIINFYLQMIAERSKADLARAERGKTATVRKVHVFSSFFYPKLVQAGYSGVRRWTRKVDLFSQDIVLIPIHLGMHWCLATIDFSQEQLVYYDSLLGSNHSCINRLRDYLQEESMDKRRVTLDLSSWRCLMPKDIPRQSNGSDCGVFTCMYARFAARGLDFTFSQADMHDIRAHMICEILEQCLF